MTRHYLSAGHLQTGDVIVTRRGRGAVVASYSARIGYPNQTLAVQHDDSPVPELLAVLPWDDFELVAQSIDGDFDIEAGP